MRELANTINDMYYDYLHALSSFASTTLMSTVSNSKQIKLANLLAIKVVDLINQSINI